MHLETLLPLLLDLLVKSVAVLLLAAATAWVCCRTSAANRHAIWLAAFVVLLLLPCTKLVRPFWSYEWKHMASSAAPAVPPMVVASTVLPAAPAERAFAASDEVEQARPVNWPAVAVMLWLVGGLFLAARRGAVGWQVRRLVRGSQVLEDRRVLVMSERLGIPVRTSGQCRVPLVAGLWRPVVLLPPAALSWSDARLAAALQHELGHVRRGDCLARLLADTVCVLYWMNPLLWLVARAMRVAQEQACDDLVLGSGVDATDYARQLVDIVRSLGGDHFSTHHALAMAQPSTLETRVRSIVDETRDRRPLTRRMVAGGLAAAVAALALCGVAQLSGETKEVPKQTLAASKPGASAPQVYITSKFVEIAEDSGLLPGLKWLPPVSKSAVLGEEQMRAALKALSQKKGVDMMSAPSVTTKSGVRAVVEVIREFVYPTQWKGTAKTGDWEPELPFKTQNIGVTLAVDPTVQENGTIDLKLGPEVVEFLGFVDLDEGGKPAPPAAGSPKPFWDSSRASQAGTVPAGHRASPVFSTRKLTTTASLLPGQSLVMAVPPARQERGDGAATDVQMPGSDGHRRQLLVFVTATVVKPQGTLGMRQPAFAEDWLLKGFIHQNGEPQALLFNSKTEELRWVKTTQDKDGFKLLKTDGKDGNVSVEVAKAGEAETATFTFSAKGERPQIEEPVKQASATPPEPSAGPTPGDDELVSVSFPDPGVPMLQILSFYEGLTGKKVIHDGTVDAVKFAVESTRPLPKKMAVKFVEKSLRLNGYGFAPAGDGKVKFLKLPGSYTVFGEVKRQGKYTIAAEGTRFSQAIEMAGGFKALASPRQMKIVRQGPGGDTTIEVKEGDDPVLQGGDVIIIKGK